MKYVLFSTIGYFIAIKIHILQEHLMTWRMYMLFLWHIKSKSETEKTWSTKHTSPSSKNSK